MKHTWKWNGSLPDGVHDACINAGCGWQRKARGDGRHLHLPAGADSTQPSAWSAKAEVCKGERPVKPPKRCRPEAAW